MCNKILMSFSPSVFWTNSSSEVEYLRYFFSKFKLHDYVHMDMVTVVLFQRTVLQYNEKCGGLGIKQIKKLHGFFLQIVIILKQSM